jgi:AraC-like DNA-binding protein
MAQQVSLSPSRFHAVYKAMFDISPMADVINAKIDRAKTLLIMDEKIGILEISERLGYSNQYHFIRQFKAATGMTPGQYRKKNL